MRLIAPMLATPGDPPENTGDWAAEMKYDGFRLLAAVGDGEPPVLWTRNLNAVTSSYPEVATALSETFDRRGRLVFDGESVALAQGRPSFTRLQKRANTLRPTTALRRQVPVTYLPFDVLAADGGDLTAAPYRERRAALTDLGHELHGAGLPIQILPHWVSVDAAVILEAADKLASYIRRVSRPARLRRASTIQVPEQSSRELASADLAARAGDETLRIDAARAAISVGVLVDLTTLPATPTPIVGGRVSAGDGRPVHHLA